MHFTKLSKSDARIRARLEKVREGIATGLGMRTTSIEILFMEQKSTPGDPLAQRGYFGVTIFPGAQSERRVRFTFINPVTAPLMIRTIVNLPPSLWTTKGKASRLLALSSKGADMGEGYAA